MKKSMLFLCAALTTISLTAFAYINMDNTATDQEGGCSEIVRSEKQIEEDINEKALPDFSYAIGTRFDGIKKTELDNIKTFTDFLSKEHTLHDVSYKSVSVIILDDNRRTNVKETGKSGTLNAAQLKLLQSADYSTNILITAYIVKKNKETGELEDINSTPHLTIVPEMQANYVNGNDALIDYLKDNSKEQIAIVKEETLQSGKLYFTVTKKGTISNIRVEATSGYPSIDNTMIDLMEAMPGKWEAAENYKGEKVDQTLVLSFGMIGC